jgi:hypothetical protein
MERNVSNAKRAVEKEKLQTLKMAKFSSLLRKADEVESQVGPRESSKESQNEVERRNNSVYCFHVWAVMRGK